MSTKQPDTAEIDHPAEERQIYKPARKRKPKCKHVGGSTSDKFNLAVARATLNSFWVTTKEEGNDAADIMVAALKGIAPKDELEGMLAGQLVAAHQASLECFRRAMLQDQTLDGRAMNLTQANKASRTYATLLESLNRYRGKGGQQRVVVEHVTVNDGGQAIVGAVQHGSPGGRGHRKKASQPHASRIAHSPQPLAPMWSEDAERQAVPVAGDEERPVSNARRR